MLTITQMMQELEDQWNQLLGEHAALPGLSQETFLELVKHYSEPERAYHNLDHIVRLLDCAKAFRSRLGDYQSICLAIWFHDVIYNPLSNDNESESATFAETHLARLLFAEETIAKVKELILATAHHIQELEANHADTAFMLDFDLAVLGGTPEEYKKYCSQIRNEYSSIPDLLYVPGRKRILHRFLATKRIYKTEEFYLLHEHQARVNIVWELGQLG